MKHFKYLIVFVALLLTAACGEETEEPPTPEVSSPEQLKEQVARFYEARAADDTAFTNAFFTDSSRIWFQQAVGRGEIRTPQGQGPWATWDNYFQGKQTVDSMTAGGDSVVAYVTEDNYFYRLGERPPRQFHATYYFNDDGRVTGTLIRQGKRPPDSVDRFPEAVKWLRETYPDEMKELVSEGRLNPSLPNARKWKELLNKWREEHGLEIIDWEPDTAR